MKKEYTYFDKPENQKKVRQILYGCCAALIALDIFFPKHGHFAWEGWFGFFSVYGFVCCVILVIAAKHILRPATMRDEDYYDK